MPATDLERLEPVLAQLRASAPAAPERLRARVLAGGPAPRSRRARGLVLVLAAAALVAVAAAAVHGLSGGGGSGGTRAQRLGLAETATTGTAASDSGAAAKAPAPAMSSMARARLQHVEATLQVQVADADALQRATAQATRVATSLGGWAQSVDYGTQQDGGGDATLDLKVPVEKVDVAVTRLAALGTLLSQQLDQHDLQQQLAAEGARIAQLRRRVAALAKAVADPSLPAGQKVLLRIQLQEARRALAQATNRRKGTKASGATADVSLTLTTNAESGAAAPGPGRFRRGLDFLVVEATVLFYVVVVAAPPALLGLAAWWLGRGRRRRGEATLLSA